MRIIESVRRFHRAPILHMNNGSYSTHSTSVSLSSTFASDEFNWQYEPIDDLNETNLLEFRWILLYIGHGRNYIRTATSCTNQYTSYVLLSHEALLEGMEGFPME